MLTKGRVAWKLLQDASCTEEQIDAVALLALSLQKRFDARPDKKTHLCPVAIPDNNHRAVWLGGGGVNDAQIGQTYEHQQGRKIVAAMQYVVGPYLTTSNSTIWGAERQFQ